MAATSATDTAVDTLRTLLSESADMRTWLGVATALLALDRIIKGGYDFDADRPALPFVTIDDDEDEYESIGVDTSIANGTLTIVCEREISEDNQADAQAAKNEMNEKWGELLSIVDAQRAAETGGVRMLIGRVGRAADGKPTFFPVEKSDNNQAPYQIWSAALTVEWGPSE